jgi:hypothetical protein
MSISPRFAGEPAIDESSVSPTPTTFYVGSTTLPTSFRARSRNGTRSRRGSWFSLSAQKFVSTSHFVAVSVGRAVASVAPVPGRTCRLVEVADQFGNVVRSRVPCIVRWPPGTECRIREIRPTCISVALHRRGKAPLNSAVVRSLAGTVVLGRVGHLRCTRCRVGFDTPEEALHHFGLPPLEVRHSVDGGTIPYLEPRHSKSFQRYLKECADNPARIPTELLPQLNPDELREKLEALVVAQTKP